MDTSDAPVDQDTCRRCGGRLVPVVYGLPGPDLFEAAERGEVALGGCLVADGQPTRRCQQCGAGSRPRRRAR